MRPGVDSEGGIESSSVSNRWVQFIGVGCMGNESIVQFQEQTSV